MDENKIENDIKNVTAQSPVSREVQAAKSMNFPAAPEGQTTLVTGDIEGNVADQIVDTPDRGIAFDPNSTEVYTGGTALPNLNYNTRRQTPEGRGNPLYFEPNYQPVVPYVVNTPAGAVESTTLDSQKLAWQLAVSNGLGDDRNYVGYIPVPDVGRLSWWSHFVGGTKGLVAAAPLALAQGVSGAVGAASKALTYVESPFIEAAVDLANGNPDSIVSDVIKGVNLKSGSATGELFNTFNTMMDAVDNAVSPTEKLLIQSFDADPEDQSFRAQSARGVASGVVSFGIAAMTGNPELTFALLNFANANEMRKQALSAGVAPLWAEAYSIAAPTINTALDAIQFDVYINGLGTVAGSMTDLYKSLTASGLVKFGEAVARHGLEMVGEAGTEMVQESIEGAFDPDFLANPEDRLAIAALSAIAIKGATIPVSVRHAKWEKQVELAKSLGVYDQLAAVRTATKDLVESWAKAGRINENQKNELMEMIMREAPDKVIRDLRAGVKGQLDKIPAKDRAEFAETLRNIDPKAVTQQEFDKLNTKVDAALAGFNISDDLKTMTKGLINGAAHLLMVTKNIRPSEITLPRFVLKKSGDSEMTLDNKGNYTVAISKSWPDTEYTKVRGSDTSKFNPLISPNFVPSTAQSDFMSSLIHELGHWVDYQIGETGFSDFLEHYYNNIAKVFGNEKALAVYNASKEGAARTSLENGKVSYKSNKNATEYMAQALSRLGKRSAEYFGLGKSKANRFLSYANLMLNQMSQFQGAAGKRNADMIARVQEAMAAVVGRNAQIIDDMIEAYGSDRIRQAVQEYMRSGANRDMSMTEYLMEHDVLKDLYDVLDSFADAATLNKVRDFFDSTEQIESFVTAGDTYFNTGYDNEVEAVKQRRAEAAQKAAQKAGTAPATTTAKNNVKQVALSNGQTVSVPKNVQNYGGDKGIDAVRKLLKGDNEAVENERMSGWHGTKWLFDQFKLLMSGKGEGGMAHGYGVYVTTEKKRAKHYWHDIALRDNQIPVDIVYKYWDYEASKFRDGRLSVMDNPPLHEAFMGWYNEFASRHDDVDDILWYTREPLLHNGFYPDEYEDASERAMGKAGTLMRYVKNFSKGISDTEQIVDINFEINKDFGQLMQIMTPDTDLMLHEGAKRNAQPPKVDDILTAMRPEIETMLTQFYKGQQAKDPDLWSDEDVASNVKKDLDVYDSSDSGDIYNVVERAVMGVNGITNRYDAARQASKFLSDHGIMGNFYFGNVDGMSAVVFDPATLEIMDIIRNHEDIEEADRIANPNDYVTGTDPVAEIQQAFEQGKNDPADETPSYDVEVDGRKLGEDIAGLTQGIMKRAKNLPNKIVKWAASSPWGWGLDRIMITMFGRDVAEKLDVGGKYTQRNALRSGMFNRFMKNLEPIIGNIETDNRAAMFKYKTMLNQLGFVRVKDVEINNPVVPELSNKRDLTGWEVMYVYLMKRMGEKYGNRVQQSAKTDINELIATLTDEEKQFADTMSDTLRSIWADRVGEDRAVFNYFPIMDAEHSFFDETNIDNLKARMETDAPISIEDAGRLFSKEISRMSSWESGYYRTLKRIRDVLQYKGAEGRNIDPAVDDDLKRASGILAGQIKDIFGIDGYHNILRLLDQQIADPQEQMLDSAASKTLNQMGMNVIKGLLSFKFMSLPKNMTNLAMMWGGASNQSTYWNGFAEGVGNMKRTWEYMMKHSKEIQIRYKDAGYNEFLDQRNTGGNTAPIFKGMSRLFAKMDWGSDKTGGMAKMSAALDMMGDAGLKLFMLNGDAVANIYGGYGLIKDYMAQGMTEEEAFRKLDRYIVEHQSSSNLAMKPLRQLEANKSLAGQLFAFTSEGVAKWASVLGTFDEVQMGTATKSEAIANALSVAASMVLFAFLSAGVWDLWDDDDKIREEAVKSLEGAMIDQVFGATIMGNGFITPMIQNLAGVGGNTGISAPIWSVVSEGITNLKRGEYDRIATKAMEASGLLIGANALYNNIQGMMFMNADDPDLREAGFRMLSGRTVGYAEKRTGAKIRKRNNENVENSDEE